jgi:hypothetical protein
MQKRPPITRSTKAAAARAAGVRAATEKVKAKTTINFSRSVRGK